jgi:hypothetical protein
MCVLICATKSALMFAGPTAVYEVISHPGSTSAKAGMFGSSAMRV